jgi:hypothetical protein
MNWAEKIKNKIGRYLLQKASTIRNSKHIIPTFESVKEIGIIYHAGFKDNEEEINKIAHFLRDQGKKVWMIGFVDAKTLPNNKKFHISSEYFWKEKLSYFNLPNPSLIGNFIHHKFDLLLNLYFEEDLPLQGLSNLSEANYAMGAQIPNALNYNDSIIDTGNNLTLQNLASQMVHYLKVINQK